MSTYGGRYTGCIMRSYDYGGNNCDDWRVLSGGKWYMRNSTHTNQTETIVIMDSKEFMVVVDLVW